MKKFQKYRNSFVLICCMIGGMLSCVTEYTPKGVEQIGGMLVVEGIISQGETSVRLSYSVGILEDVTDESYISDAEVYVVCDDGSQSNRGEHIYKGTYRIETGDLDVTKQYKLYVSAGGKVYESTFLTPMVTPEVDSVFWEKKGKGEPVRILIATQDRSGGSQFYRWTYEENWEFHSSFMATIDPTGTIEYDIRTSNNVYNCWGKDSSRVFILGSTEKLSEARISQKELTQMLPSSDKLSYLYHIGVTQMALRKEAYDYFYNLQKNVESTGGIFGSMPTELRGNISCVSNPDEYVIGYVEVSIPTSIERYIDYQEGLYERPSMNCEIVEDWETAQEMGYILFDKSPMTNYYAATKCVDCRLRGSKKKPSWWPTESL